MPLGSYEDALFHQFQVIGSDDFIHVNRGGSQNVEHSVHTQKSLIDILTQANCPALDLVLYRFNSLFSKTYTKQDIVHDAEICLHIAYFGFMQYMAGAIRVDEHDKISSKEVGKYLFDLFKQAKMRYRKEMDIEHAHTFIDRLFPLIEARIAGGIHERDKKRLDDMYALIMRKFKGIYRDMLSYDGKKITYVTHLKEVFLTMLFNSEDITVDDLLIALGHDLLEDTDVTKEQLITWFGPHVAFGILQLTKQSVEEKVNRLVEHEELTLDEKALILTYKDYRNKVKRDEIDRIPQHYMQWESDYYAVKEKIREDYVIALQYLSQYNEIYFDPQTLEVLDDNNPVLGCEKMHFRTICATKCSDICNNLATLHDMSEKQMRRKREQAYSILPLAKKYAHAYVPILEYWITYW